MLPQLQRQKRKPKLLVNQRFTTNLHMSNLRSQKKLSCKKTLKMKPLLTQSMTPLTTTGTTLPLTPKKTLKKLL
jgi:hypothetical protein